MVMMAVVIRAWVVAMMVIVVMILVMASSHTYATFPRNQLATSRITESLRRHIDWPTREEEDEEEEEEEEQVRGRCK
ncbi:hypothetical protein E2C01_092647 [Portunus trituberculatus]|uniref:Uncharacterized protein n=1 Tax=Portunus trituberculatus TaxID=210409 RepID=A0A5B7JW02_PORTR|nr:hypothetical protein [Portunus trituberculatus]